jgi:metal-sulfur cluster biosynthetic enzyme
MPNHEEILKAIEPIQDPEIPISLVDLGLIYESTYNEEEKNVHVKMTLTSMGCPAAGQLVSQVKGRVEEMDDVETCDVEVVYSPAWRPTMATDKGKIQLQAMGINI